MRLDAVAGHPGAVEALERVGGWMDNATMRELNRKVAVCQRERREVAVEFLKAKGGSRRR